MKRRAKNSGVADHDYNDAPHYKHTSTSSKKNVMQISMQDYREGHAKLLSRDTEVHGDKTSPHHGIYVHFYLG